jgi:hypothetical protein
LAVRRCATWRRNSAPIPASTARSRTKLNELAILVTQRFWNRQYEWYAHHKYGLQAGRSAALIDAIAAGNPPAEMAPDEAAVCSSCHVLLETRQVSDATFDAVKEEIRAQRRRPDGRRRPLPHRVDGPDRYPLPDGAKPELQALK